MGLAQAGVEFMDGLENLLGFLHEYTQNFVIDQLIIRCLGGLWCFSWLLNIHLWDGRRFALLLDKVPGWLLAHWEAKPGQAVFGHSQNGIVVADAFRQALQVVFDTG